jgi:two-component system response regulator AtoC
MTTVLIAEDDAALRDLLGEILTRDHHVIAAADGVLAKRLLVEQPVDVVVSDIRMPGADGIALLAAARATSRPPPVILLTAYGSIAQAVEAMRLGAFDYLTKPLESPDVLRGAVARALRDGNLGARSTATAPPVFVDPSSLALLELVDKVAGREATVLLQGETGVGKEVIAREIHARSRRAAGPFVAINCGAIPEQLAESYFFGHARGSFTGAEKDRIGLFEAAEGGTLFLDEIGELDSPEQAALLRVLEERRFRRVGEVRDRPVDVRVIAATHRDLDAGTTDRHFREDLYYRLAEFPIRIAPLRERPGDILPLALAFLATSGCGGVTISESAQARLLTHPWPGNARELRNVVLRASILAPGEVIDEHQLGLAKALASRRVDVEPRAHGPSAATLQDIERRAIEEALEATGGNRRATAERLGISLRGLQYKLKAGQLTRR